MSKNKTTLRGPNIKIELDKDEIYPDDPGQGTPVLIEAKIRGQNCFGTWACWEGEGEVDGIIPTPEQQRWLESKRAEVEKWMEENGV